MNDLKFTVWEMLSLVGVFQCVYIMVYIAFRVTTIKQVILPFFYFLVLASGFFLDFAKGYIGQIMTHYDLMVWLIWAFSIPLSVLLIIQIAQLSRLPPFSYWLILFIMPLCLGFSLIMAGQGGLGLCQPSSICLPLSDWLRITGLIGGALSLLLIWGQRNLLEDLHAQKAGQERYWLILALVFLNIALLIIIGAGGNFNPDQSIALSRTILGLAFVYLTTTSLLRIYPQALVLAVTKRVDVLTPEDLILVQRIENLLTLDKVYHEPTYSRADLAKELNISEASVSRIINLHYKKSLPQLLNEKRIADAKRLLLDTNANIKIVAQEVGFNSIPSFNRVFKELEGCNPSDFRKESIK